MAETTAHIDCPEGCGSIPKVLSANFNFPYGGRTAFHDGPEHDGRTVRETVNDQVAEWKRTGTPFEPAGARWI